jgi:hypothetical protein
VANPNLLHSGSLYASAIRSIVSEKSLFVEYLNSKKKLAKPVVDATGDQIDPKTSPVKPPKAKNRYKPGVVKPKTGKNWGDLGEKNLVYEPDTKNPHGCKPAKIPTAEQVQISNSFINFVRQDPTLLETFVRQLKINGIYGAVIAEVFDHQETAKHLSEIASHSTYGPKLQKTLRAVLDEEVSKPFSDQLEEDEEEDPFAEEEDDLDMEGDEDDEDMDGEDDLDVGTAEEDPNADPMMGDMSGMDPSMMGDPNMMDPSMMGGPMGNPMMPQMPPNPMMDPNMMGNPMMPQMPPNPMMPQMSAFQKAMMRAKMRKR